MFYTTSCPFQRLNPPAGTKSITDLGPPTVVHWGRRPRIVRDSTPWSSHPPPRRSLCLARAEDSAPVPRCRRERWLFMPSRSTPSLAEWEAVSEKKTRLFDSPPYVYLSRSYQRDVHLTSQQDSKDAKPGEADLPRHFNAPPVSLLPFDPKP